MKIKLLETALQEERRSRMEIVDEKTLLRIQLEMAEGKNLHLSKQLDECREFINTVKLTVESRISSMESLVGAFEKYQIESIEKLKIIGKKALDFQSTLKSKEQVPVGDSHNWLELQLSEEFVFLQMRLENLFEQNRNLLTMYSETMAERNELEGTTNMLNIYLSEGNIVLDEARKEIEDISREYMFQQQGESKDYGPQELTVNVSHKMLLHAYMLTKNLEDRISGLCKVVRVEMQKQEKTKVLECQTTLDVMVDGESSQMQLQNDFLRECGTLRQINHVEDDRITVPVAVLKNDLDTWDHNSKTETNQISLNVLEQEHLARNLQSDLEEMQLKLTEAEGRIFELSTTVGKLMFSNEQWMCEKVTLNENLERLQSLVCEKERDLVGLKNEEATLEAVVKKMHEEESQKADNLGKLRVKLGIVEEQRSKLEQAYGQLLQDNGNDKKVPNEGYELLFSGFQDKGNKHVYFAREVDNFLLSLKSFNDTKEGIYVNHKNLKINEQSCFDFTDSESQDSRIESYGETMQRVMSKMLIIMEEKLRKAEATWKKEKMEILLELNKAKLDAAHNIRESDKILQNFQEGHEAMKEAEVVVYSLLQAREAKEFESSIITKQWELERTFLTAKLKKMNRSLLLVTGNFISHDDGNVDDLRRTINSALTEVNHLMRGIEQLIAYFDSGINLTNELMVCQRVPGHVIKGLVPKISDKGKYADSCSIKNVSGFLDHLESLLHGQGSQISHLRAVLNALQKGIEKFFRSKDLAGCFFPSLHKAFESNQGDLTGLVIAFSAVLNELLASQYGLRETESSLFSSCETLLAIQGDFFTCQNSLQTGEIDETLKNLQSKLLNVPHKMEELNDSKMKRSELQCSEIPESEEHTVVLVHSPDFLGKLDEKYVHIIERSCKRHSTMNKLANYRFMQSLDSYESKILHMKEVIERNIESVMKNEKRMYDLFANGYSVIFFKVEHEINACQKYLNILYDKLEQKFSENEVLMDALERKDELLKGSLFDLSLLQECTAESKYGTKEANSWVRVLIKELEAKVRQLEILECDNHDLEQKLREKINEVHLLSSELSVVIDHASVLERGNTNLKHELERLLIKNKSMERSLKTKQDSIEELELEIVQMNTFVEQKMIQSLENVNSELSMAVKERDQLHSEMLVLSKELEEEQSNAAANNAAIFEAQQIVEISKVHVQEKEEVIKLLEQTVEELESTVTALDTQVNLAKSEAESQRLMKEDIEMELQILRHHILNNALTDTETDLQIGSGIEFQLQMVMDENRSLEKESKEKDVEIRKCKEYIAELLMAAERETIEHQQKLQELEAMVESEMNGQGRCTISSTGKMLVEKTSVKRSSSPFKCVSFGLANHKDCVIFQQKIEELKALAASRKKEVFVLKKKLAQAESMTHAVIRDLLGIKLDLSVYAEKELEELNAQIDDERTR